jgi:hypothetical protein
MSKPSTAPYVVRWRDALLADDHPALTWRAITAAMALTLYADVKTGRNCYPGKAACAAKMRVSRDTIQRGWDELVEAGWLEIQPLPEERRRSQGALKVLRWPKRGDLVADSTQVLSAAYLVADSTQVLSAAYLVADSTPTIPGNGEPSGPSALQAGTPGESGPPEGWTAAEERAARAEGLVCSRCDHVVSFFPPQPPGPMLCQRCLDEEDA